jgi:hypothetical protein
MAMDTTLKLRALGLALTMVAAAAGTGWALQLPLTATVEAGAIEVPHVTTPAEVPAPSLSLMAWPQPAAVPDDGASARARADGSEEIIGLEEMSATGAASPQR